VSHLPEWVLEPDIGYKVIETHTSLPRPEGIYWKLLPPEKIEAIPALRKMVAHPTDLG
jgi:hypothetical protein